MPLFTQKVKVTSVAVNQVAVLTPEGQTTPETRDEFTFTLTPVGADGRASLPLSVTVPDMGDIKAGETYTLNLVKG